MPAKKKIETSQTTVSQRPASSGPIPPLGSLPKLSAPPPKGPVARASGIDTESPAASDGSEGPTEDEWNFAADNANQFSEEDAPPEPAPKTKRIRSKEGQKFGPETQEFAVARAAIAGDTEHLLTELLRADFKFVEEIDPGSLR